MGRQCDVFPRDADSNLMRLPGTLDTLITTVDILYCFKMFQVKQEDVKQEIEDIDCLQDVETYDEFFKYYKQENEVSNTY